MHITEYGKIDLHLHLDGSIPVQSLIDIAQKEHVMLPEYDIQKLMPYLTSGRDCESLNAYLRCFNLPLEILQSEWALAEGARALAEEMQKKGLIYAEVRFAPQLHTRKGLTQDEAVEAVLDGLSKSSMKTRVILCCMRGTENEAENIQTVKTAARYLHKGVAAVDLAGAEALYPTCGYAQIFKEALRADVPFTIHAGEAAGPESIRQALLFGAKRIGHGVRAEEDGELMQKIAKSGVVLEMCPTSNLQTKAVDSLSEYPLREFLDRGIKVTVNSDNMTVSGTSVPEEFRLLEEEYGLTESEAGKLLYNAADGAFLPAAEKAELKNMIEKQGIKAENEAEQKD